MANDSEVGSDQREVTTKPAGGATAAPWHKRTDSGRFRLWRRIGLCAIL
ncbi:MAG: hypothetical protein LLH30_04220 [Candidatus Manganitrophus sp. SA1]|nr:hypothetical protein [Candidatus Manganitrophus morganii]